MQRFLRNFTRAVLSKIINKMTPAEEAKQKLRTLGYAFNEETGILCELDSSSNITNNKYNFKLYGDNDDKNRDHYEKIARTIYEIVYEILEKVGMKRIYIPLDAPQEKATFIFSQPVKLHKSKKLLILIHGTGYVRAGIWARSIIINNSVDEGSQIPYIKKALELGYDILITNQNSKHSYSGFKQLDYVFNEIVMPSEPEAIAIVAHSYGGYLTTSLAHKYEELFGEKVFGIALTDSVHDATIARKVMKRMGDRTRNWVTSELPLDKDVPQEKQDFKKVSAGHTKHEWTSTAAISSVFDFLEEKYNEFSTYKETAKKPKLN